MFIKLLLWSILIGSVVMGYFGIQSGSAGNAAAGIGIIILIGFSVYFLLKVGFRLGIVLVKFILIIAVIGTVILLGVKGCQFLYTKGKGVSESVVETTKEVSHQLEEKAAGQGYWERAKRFLSFKPGNDGNTVTTIKTPAANRAPIPVLTPPPPLPTIEGVVDEVRTGYLFRIGAHFIKLYGVDAPDLKQTCINKRGETYDCGRESQKMLQRLILGKTVTCQPVKEGYNDNYIATCTIRDFDVGASMIAVGWAVEDRNATNVYTPYEEEAHINRKGLWEGKFIAPWEFRATHIRTTSQKQKKSGFLERLFK